MSEQQPKCIRANMACDSVPIYYTKQDKFYCDFHAMLVGIIGSSQLSVSQDRYIMDRYSEFWYRQSLWSQQTFGLDRDRGPIGPLRHLEKEVKEAIDEVYNPEQGSLVIDSYGLQKVVDTGLHMEIVDCFFLVTDAARRSGLDYNQFMDLVDQKLEINKNRTWNKSTTDEPVEHDRSKE